MARKKYSPQEIARKTLGAIKGPPMTTQGLPLTGPDIPKNLPKYVAQKITEPQAPPPMPIPDEEYARKVRRRRQSRRGRTSTVLTGDTLGQKETLA